MKRVRDAEHIQEIAGGPESEPGALPARHLEDSGRQGLRPCDGHRKRAGRRQGGCFGGGQGAEKRESGGPSALRAGFPDIQGHAPRPGNLQPVFDHANVPGRRPGG